MGAPKQKWTSEEEAALKAGIQKYGVGKWSTILKDPEFSTVLRSRSNVDLKDKWRNLNCMENGTGSRHRARISNKNNQLTVKHNEDVSVPSMNVAKYPKPIDIAPLASYETSESAAPSKMISRLDDLILEAITKLKEPRGSSRSAIAKYIEESYSTPPDFEMILTVVLKNLSETGRLVKVKNQYRIAPKPVSSDVGKVPLFLSANGVKKSHSEAENCGGVLLTRAQVEADLEKMKNMGAEEAAAAAAKAVAEAEAAIAAAEAAAKEAEEAEAEAEAAHCFADAAQKALTCQAIRAW